jgi:hypothetical protein
VRAVAADQLALVRFRVFRVFRGLSILSSVGIGSLPLSVNSRLKGAADGK